MAHKCLHQLSRGFWRNSIGELVIVAAQHLSRSGLSINTELATFRRAVECRHGKNNDHFRHDVPGSSFSFLASHKSRSTPSFYLSIALSVASDHPSSTICSICLSTGSKFRFASMLHLMCSLCSVDSSQPPDHSRQKEVLEKDFAFQSSASRDILDDFKMHVKAQSAWHISSTATASVISATLQRT